MSLDAREKEIKALRNNIQVLQASIDSQAAQLKLLRDTLAERNEQIKTIQGQNNVLGQNLQQAMSEIWRQSNTPRPAHAVVAGGLPRTGDSWWSYPSYNQGNWGATSQWISPIAARQESLAAVDHIHSGPIAELKKRLETAEENIKLLCRMLEGDGDDDCDEDDDYIRDDDEVGCSPHPLADKAAEEYSRRVTEEMDKMFVEEPTRKFDSADLPPPIYPSGFDVPESIRRSVSKELADRIDHIERMLQFMRLWKSPAQLAEFNNKELKPIKDSVGLTHHWDPDQELHTIKNHIEPGPKRDPQCWEAIRTADSTDKAGMWHIRWSDPDENGNYCSTGFYGYNEARGERVSQHMAERHAENFNKQGRHPRHFDSFSDFVGRSEINGAV